MTALEHSPVNRADAARGRDQSGAEPRTQVRVVEEEFDRLLSDDGAHMGWVHGQPVYTAERLGHLRRIILEQLEGVPALPQAIDSAALIEVLRDAIPPRMTEGYYARVADRVLALVRPVEGVVLTTEEARLAERALREYGAEPYTLDYSDSDAMDALAARLEATS